MKQWIFSGLLVVVAMVSICSVVMAEEQNPPPQIVCPKGYHPVGNRCVPN